VDINDLQKYVKSKSYPKHLEYYSMKVVGIQDIILLFEKNMILHIPELRKRKNGV